MHLQLCMPYCHAGPDNLHKILSKSLKIVAAYGVKHKCQTADTWINLMRQESLWKLKTLPM